MLLSEIFFASLCIEIHEDEHDDDEGDDNQCQIYIDQEEGDDGRKDFDHGEEYVGKGIVKGIDDTVDIIGEIGHYFTMGMGVKITDWKNLHLLHQFRPDLEKDSLGCPDHDCVIDESTKETHRADDDDWDEIVDERLKPDLFRFVDVVDDVIRYGTCHS